VFSASDLVGKVKSFNTSVKIVALIGAPNPGEVIVALDGGDLAICDLVPKALGRVVDRTFTGHWNR